MSERTPFNVQTMAKMLEFRKNNGHATVLLLGARAGALFRSEHFFRLLQDISPRDLTTLSRIARFSEYYSILLDGRFSETDIHSIIRKSFENLSTNKADSCFADLVKQGHFTEIISTNIDDLLEKSFEEVEMREHHDFEVITSPQNLLSERSSPVRINKIFGDFSVRNYSVSRYLSEADKDQDYRSVLRNLLSKDILLFGIDPKWDKHILNLIPLDTQPGKNKQGMVWVVSEEDFTQEEVISSILHRRQAQSIVDREVRLDYFFIALHAYLYGGMPFNYQMAHTISTRLAEITSQLADISSQLTEVLHKIQTAQEDQKQIFSEVKDIQKKVDKFLHDGSNH